jgi:predicted permease
MIERIAQDLRFAGRMFRRTPGFTVVAVLIMALSIAANVSVFSFVNALFLRELPVKDASRLVRVYGTARNQDARFFSYSEYAYLRDRTKTVEQLVVHYSTAPLYVTVDTQAGEVQGAVVSANYFPALGVTPQLGRFFSPQEDSVPDRDAVAVIGDGLWRNWFGGDSNVLGKTIRINNRPFQVIGVAPKSFQGVEVGSAPNQLWIPAMMLRTGYRWCDALREQCTTLSILGRLAPGKSIQQANAEMTALAGSYAKANPGPDVSQGALVTPAQGARSMSQRYYLRVARLLSISAIALLLIGCINLAGLLMARGTARSKEIALRLSLGAARGRVLQQLLTESMLLSVLGGALGLVLSLWTNQLLMGISMRDPEGYQRLVDVSLDPLTVVYAIALSLLTGALFGILPAIQSARQDTAPVLKADAGSRSRRALVTCQIALSLTLLVGAGLMARSVTHIETGQAFDPQHVALLRLRPRLVGYAPDRAQTFQRDVVRRLESTPGIVSVSLTAGDGFTWMEGFKVRFSLPGDERAVREPERIVWRQQIAPKFFSTLRIGFEQGRDFDDRDRPGSPQVTILSETLARQLWPGAPATDRTVVIEHQPYRVIGVAKDSQLRTAGEGDTPMLYTPYWQNATVTDSRMCIRVAGDPEAALTRIKAAISSVDPNVPITEALPMIQQVRGTFANILLARAVLLCAGGLALLLTAIGLYGVLAFVVGRRTREIGIRMAIGAKPEQVMKLFLKQGLTLIAMGCGAGLLLAFATSRLLAAFLYGVRASDPVSFVAGAAILCVVALVATYLPSRRAARVNPIEALRQD